MYTTFRKGCAKIQPKIQHKIHSELKHNITNTIRKIQQEKYKKIFKGAYERPEKYVAKNKTRKVKKNYL
jgi:hypothetical protein